MNFRKYENFTANITIDDFSLDSYIFSSNASGNWLNQSLVDISGTQFNASSYANISVGRGTQVCWQYFANDSSSNSNTSDLFCFNVTNTNPIFNVSLETQIVDSESVFTYHINCSDIDGDTVTYHDNSSLFVINSSTGLINYTAVENEIGSEIVNITCSDGTINVSESFNFTINDATVATFSDALNTSVHFKKHTNFTANITINDTELYSYIFSTNATGVWVNQTAVSIGSLEQYNATATANISVGRGSSMCWQYYANDSNANIGNSSIYCFTVNNTAPVFNSSANQSATVGSLFTYQVDCRDVDGDTLTYTDNSTLFNITTAGSINDTPVAGDIGTHAINVTCSDAEYNASTVFNYVVSAAPVAEETSTGGGGGGGTIRKKHIKS